MKPKNLRRLMRKEVQKQYESVQTLIAEEAEKTREQTRRRIAPKPWWLPFRLWEFLLGKLLIDFSKGGDVNDRA